MPILLLLLLAISTLSACVGRVSVSPARRMHAQQVSTPLAPCGGDNGAPLMSDLDTLRSDAQKWIDATQFPAAPPQLKELAITMYVAGRLDNEKLLAERNQDVTYCVEAITKLLKLLDIPTDEQTMHEINTVIEGVMQRVKKTHG